MTFCPAQVSTVMTAREMFALESKESWITHPETSGQLVAMKITIFQTILAWQETKNNLNQ